VRRKGLCVQGISVYEEADRRTHCQSELPYQTGRETSRNFQFDFKPLQGRSCFDWFAFTSLRQLIEQSGRIYIMVALIGLRSLH
jgi:hypothetical protein